MRLVDKTGSVVKNPENIFEELGLEHSPEDMLKVKIALAITSMIQDKKLTQVQVGKVIGESQARVSNLVRGRLGRFSVQKLFEILMALHYDIDIVISPSRNERGKLRVRAA